MSMILLMMELSERVTVQAGLSVEEFVALL
jgi:hypothetical protein